MANKKKSKSKQKKSKRPTSSAKSKARHSTVKAKTAKKTRANPTSRKKATSKASDTRKKRASISPEREIKREIRNRRLGSRAESGIRSVDFEGLSRAEQADSESVDELVEEGNVFEAGAVAGVEEADDADEREVHTHELPEDDIPDEYLDKD